MVKRDDLDKPEFLSVPSAAELCGVSRNTLYSWVRQDKLKAYKTPGRTNLIRPNDLVQFMQKSGMFVPPGLVDMARRDASLGNGDEAAEANKANGSILIVDDEPAIRSVLVRALDGVAPLYQAGTGYEALHLVTVRDDVKLILLDLKMPGLMGSETIQEIHRLRPDAKIVIITGYASEMAEDISKNKNVVCILEKPIDIQSLHKAVSKVFDK